MVCVGTMTVFAFRIVRTQGRETIDVTTSILMVPHAALHGGTATVVMMLAGLPTGLVTEATILAVLLAGLHTGLVTGATILAVLHAGPRRNSR